MDYKTIYLEYYNKTLKDQEDTVKTMFTELKAENRSYSYSRDKIGSMLFSKKHEFESAYPIHILSQYESLLKERKQLYSEDSLKLIFKNEMKDIFQEKKPFGILEYSRFLENLATWIGLKDAYSNFGAHNWLMELYYEYDEIEKISLYPKIINIKENKDFIRLSSKKFPRYEKLKDSKPEISKTEVNLELPILDNDEKLLLIHYLLHSNYLEKIEKVKILALVGTTPISAKIFKQESRKNNDYNQVRKGYEYLGKKKAQEKLTSLLHQVEIFKIGNLNRAIKLDLNKLRKPEI
ncbi:hypothetical protein [Salinimicrobium terrae]|uniref:hypothetical protein n=1 Tax=Salinimicrobium terrae TaxID=470866 RepID=UPI000401C8F0|nr:hypothetical protein [Salinimicrobium terrae]